VEPHLKNSARRLTELKSNQQKLKTVLSLFSEFFMQT